MKGHWDIKNKNVNLNCTGIVIGIFSFPRLQSNLGLTENFKARTTLDKIPNLPFFRRWLTSWTRRGRFSRRSWTKAPRSPRSQRVPSSLAARWSSWRLLFSHVNIRHGKKEKFSTDYFLLRKIWHQTLPKAQRTRGLSSYHKITVHKSWTYYNFRISIKH